MTALRVFAFFFVRSKRVFLIPATGGLFLLGLLGTGTSTTYGQTLSLVWSDEFNSVTSSNVDTTKWTFDTGNNNGWGNNELEFYTRRTNNAYVAGGLLHIHAQIENTNSVSHSVTNTFNYTSARMKTQGLFNTLYGRIEWRAKLPAGTGMWPALWMMGSNSVSVPWPDCGEIDVVENDGAYPYFVQGSIHSGTDASNYYLFNIYGATTNFHVYDLDWTANSITWSVDGAAYETQTSWGTSTTNAYPYPFNQPFYLLMNLAVGGDYVNNPDTNSINPSLPNEMQVDYIRVYQYVLVVNPLIVSITPASGCASGGTAITIGGFNFQSGSTIIMNGVNATGVTFVNSNVLTAVTGANSPGTYSVVVKIPGHAPTTLTNGFTYTGPPLFAGPGSITPAIEGATLTWSAASGVAPLTYGVYEATNSGGEINALLTTNALSVFIPLYPGSNSPITYFFKVNAVNGCGTDTNAVELSAQPLLDPTKSQVGDGIPNSWKQQYGFSPFDPTVAAADPDGDGLSNLQEFLLGTNPLDNTSPFHVTAITLQGPDVLITWLSVGGMTNAVESAPDFGGSFSNISGNIVIMGTGVTTTNYLDAGAATNTPANYYRIRLVP
jgi:beta-glucanase (GH16 family)